MYQVGLTGNMGSGKSTVAKAFQVLGIPVFYADAESKENLSLPEVIGTLSREFGASILENGSIHRQRLAEIVFNDDEALRKLNGIMHPLLIERYARWVEKQSAPYVMQEAAILFESGFEHFFDKTIMVTTPEAQRIERVLRRDNISEKQVLSRMGKQWPQEKKAALADYVIANDDHVLIVPQVVKIHHEILQQLNQATWN